MPWVSQNLLSIGFLFAVKKRSIPGTFALIEAKGSESISRNDNTAPHVSFHEISNGGANARVAYRRVGRYSARLNGRKCERRRSQFSLRGDDTVSGSATCDKRGRAAYEESGAVYGRPGNVFGPGPIAGAAAMYRLIVTAKMNGVDPRAWLADILSRIATHPARR
jgi:hypothetical protein